MSHINFVIPSNRKELLSECSDYYVRNVVVPKELVQELKNARISLKDEGAEFIVNTFDVYYSVLHYGDGATTLTMDIIFRAYEDLHRAVGELKKAIGFILEDKESLNDELKMKFLTIIKMLLYLYAEFVTMIENKNITQSQGLVKGRKKGSSSEQQFIIDKKNVLIGMNHIIQQEINLFWDPPIVEENFINIVSKICYCFLQNPTIKGEKEVRMELFDLIGALIKGHNHGTTFVIRMVQLIKMHEHLVHCLPEGIQQLVQNFNCKGLVHDLIQEVTEWQTGDAHQDSQGARYCATVLSSMAVLMPNLMIPEIMYLDKYLAHEVKSATLRNSVLTVITEVVLNVLTSHELTEEQRESRDEFLEILQEHMADVSALVRAKVIQHWARLQNESAIPLKHQNQILMHVIEHLHDKGTLVRKSAIICVTTFLTHNAFSANLSLAMMQKDLDDKQKILDTLNVQFEQMKVKKLEEVEALWNSKKDDLKAAIEKELQRDKTSEEDDDMQNSEENQVNQIPKEQMAEIIRMYLNEDKYNEAFKLCKIAGEQIEPFQQFRENNDQDEVALYLLVLHSVFVNVNKLLEELKTNIRTTEEDFKQMEALEAAVDFLKDSVVFLKLIDSAIGPIIELLETVFISDMHEAVAFFIAAYQFNIDNASEGVLAMLKIMQRNEQERKECIINAFKTIYLNTDASNMEEHCSTIVRRLITLVKTVPVNNYDHLQLIISEWTAKGILDNSIIDMLWQYFTKKASVTDEDSRAAVELLKMCALGRKTIISRNIKLVATIAFGERGENDLLLLGTTCDFLAVASSERIDITSKNPPFKIKSHDEIFKNLLEILSKKFFEPVDYYNKALFGGVECIYKLCSKPEKVCEELLDKVVNRLADDLKGENKTVDRYILTRVCQMLGFIALKHTEYLDDIVYRELKRRNNIRDERKQKKSSKKGNKNRSRVSASVLNSSITEESGLEGAQAEDMDAEFILNVLENDTVTGSGGLGKLAYIIKGVCTRPNVYDDVMLQGSAVIALIRYMLVSSKFCAENIQLLFTIFEKSEYPEVKCSILVHLSDLLTRFPNVIEPYSPRIFQRLKDPLNLIRKTTFFTLSNLILRDMIRAHSHISEMACCLVDEDKELSDMSKTFFVNLSHKENNLYNVLPDIFSHLMGVEAMSEENIQEIIKFIFGLMGKSKQMENLVDRFCCKFIQSEDIREHRSIAYCLTLIQYNEKALKKLIEQFPMYKHLVHDSEIYASFRNIMQACSKQQPGKVDLKPMVTELEEHINSMFEVNEGENLMRPPPVPARKTKSKKLSKKSSTKRGKELFEDNEESNGNKETPLRRSHRSRNVTRSIRDDSDSD